MSTHGRLKRLEALELHTTPDGVIFSIYINKEAFFCVWTQHSASPNIDTSARKAIGEHLYMPLLVLQRRKVQFLAFFVRLKYQLDWVVLKTRHRVKKGCQICHVDMCALYINMWKRQLYNVKLINPGTQDVWDTSIWDNPHKYIKAKSIEVKIF